MVSEILILVGMILFLAIRKETNGFAVETINFLSNGKEEDHADEDENLRDHSAGVQDLNRRITTVERTTTSRDAGAWDCSCRGNAVARKIAAPCGRPHSPLQQAVSTP